MTWLLGQTWIWLVLAFLAGSLAAYLLSVMLLPREDEVDGLLEEPETRGGPRGMLDEALADFGLTRRGGRR